jgi:SAM-dependent methyltransferase
MKMYNRHCKSRLIVDYVQDIVLGLVTKDSNVDHLDVGAGWGHLIKKLREVAPNIKSQGCDYNPHHNEIGGLKIDHADLNNGGLPYKDSSFDLITCTEVLEHVENFRHAVREIARVARPGAHIVISTPNVLNFRSRWYFFTRGFYQYFDPLPLNNDPCFYPGELHITPIPFFYLAHSLRNSGYTDIVPKDDKPQRSSLLFLPLLAPLCRFVEKRSIKSLRRKTRPLREEIESLASGNNCNEVLTGRTLIVTARRA